MHIHRLKTYPPVSEDFLHFLWQFGLYGRPDWQTTDGDRVEVIKPGFLNRDAGPDFLDARVKIGETVWAGHIEFHLRSSDWGRHGHDDDAAYDNVVLHVVGENDQMPPHRFPTLVVGPYVPEEYLGKWRQLALSKARIPCADRVGEVDTFVVSNWVERLAIERMERKASDIIERSRAAGGDLRQSFYLTLFRYFGFRVNNDAFETLAATLPMNALEKHCDNLTQTEALLFGCAGFLEGTPVDEYHALLQREFGILARKFSLVPMDPKLWKFMRMMPRNFPTVRIAQLAALIHGRHGLYSKIMVTRTGEELKHLFQNRVSEYWNHHYRFGKAYSSKATGSLGASSVDLLLINVAAPFKFAYGKMQNQQDQIDGAMRILESVRPERNSVIRDRQALGFRVTNAIDSQGILELDSYCKAKKCLHCSIGQTLVR